jgi:ferritin-like metal-binding protein YciE
MQTGKELFLHELSDMLDAERRILETLSQQSEESSNSALQSAFQSHHKQTQGQIERLQQCFELIDEQAEEAECAAIKGLHEEHENMLDEGPSPDIMDVFNVTAAIKVERYEISSYESLIRLAELLKLSKIVRLLKQNLKEEEQTLKKVTTLAAKIKPENLDTSQGEQEQSAENFAENSTENEQARKESKTGPHIVKKTGTRRGRAA